MLRTKIEKIENKNTNKSEKNMPIENIPQKFTKTLFIYNLHSNLEEYSIYDFFSRDCRIIDLKLLKDRSNGKSKGMAYIEVLTEVKILVLEGSYECFSINRKISLWKLFNGKNFRSIVIFYKAGKNSNGELSRSKNSISLIPGQKYNILDTITESSNILIVNNLNHGIREKDLFSLFSLFGKVVKIDSLFLNNDFYYCVTFTNYTSVMLSKMKLHKIKLGGRPMSVLDKKEFLDTF
ncbi:U2 snRNA-associated protein (nucleomorph) [Bigelowiella natans]|uniref:U2 snRNA-associated protein n=1 Tax=Bigelowiella natans TaxID=227086 RepID=Q3LVU7_BIGNA|nr:U2 snRNA-associated protein [Bigelowiella natans]ABA27418.1 U2 snRNA-associated protein [Bigelowiella natans]